MGGGGVGGGLITGGGRGCEMHVSHTCHNICSFARSHMCSFQL